MGEIKRAKQTFKNVIKNLVKERSGQFETHRY